MNTSKTPTPHPTQTRSEGRTTAEGASRRRLLAGGGALALAAALSACASDDPLAKPASQATAATGGEATSGSGAIVVGSQQYYSNEIIAELYAQAIEAAGLSVERQYQIGQREVYIPELTSGTIDVLPEYGGNLLQYLDDSATATDAESIQAALLGAVPSALTVLDPAEATDQDSYTVTSEMAEEHSLTSIGDLAGLGRTVKVAANSEFVTRPYGPDGLKEVYGVDAEVTPVEDSGGPLTVKALTDGEVDVADIYTADPAIEASGLVVLDDPENLILPQRVTPLIVVDLADEAVTAINGVNALLSSEELRALNARSTNEEMKSADIARDWLTERGLV